MCIELNARQSDTLLLTSLFTKELEPLPSAQMSSCPWSVVALPVLRVRGRLPMDHLLSLSQLPLPTPEFIGLHSSFVGAAQSHNKFLM